MVDFSKHLAKMQGNWKKATARLEEEGTGGGYECPVEDGVYKAKLIKVELVENQNKKAQVHWVFAIASGSDKGEQVHDYDGLETPDNLFWFARKLAIMGVEIDEDTKSEEIAKILKKLSKDQPILSIRVKSKDGTGKHEGKTFTHVYINRLLDEDAIEDSDEDDGGDEDDDKPAKGKKGKEDESEEDEDEDESEDEDEEEDEDDEEESDDDEDEEEDEDDDDKKSKVKKSKSKKGDEEDEEDEDDEEDDEDDEDEPEESEDEGEEIELTEDMKVTWGKGKEGTILKFKDDNSKAVIETEDGKVVVAVDKLRPAEDEEAEGDEDEEEAEFEVGDEVKIEGFSGKKSTGNIEKIKGKKAYVDQNFGSTFWIEMSKLSKIKKGKK